MDRFYRFRSRSISAAQAPRGSRSFGLSGPALLGVCVDCTIRLVPASDPRRPARQFHKNSKLMLATLVWGLGFLTLWGQSYDEAVRAFQQRNYPEALAVTHELLAEDPDNAACHHLQGLIFAQLRQLPEAEASLRRSVELGPDQPGRHFDLAVILLQQQGQEEALPLLQRAVEMDGTNLMTRFYLGRTYHELNRLGQALEEFNSIAATDYSFPALHYHMARVHRNNGAAEDTIRELAAEIELYPKNVVARLELAEMLLKQGQAAEALGHLQIAETGFYSRDRRAVAVAKSRRLYVTLTALPPSHLHLLLAKAYRELGRLEKAVSSALKCVELDPDLAEPHYILAQIYQEQDQIENAAREMEAFTRLKAN